MIILMGNIQVDPRDVTEFTVDVAAISTITKSEPGCAFYAIALEDAPSGRFVMVERWQDANALATHLETEATKAFLSKWMDRMDIDAEQFEVTNAGALLGD